MLSSNDYVDLKQLSKQEVYAFLHIEGHQKIYSNKKKTFKEEIDRLVQYKDKKSYSYNEHDDKRKYMNIYAYRMIILLPVNLDKSNYCNYVNKFAVSFDPRYRKILYVYKFSKKGTANYAEIMLFTRKSSTQLQSIELKHPDDYYQDKITKRRCKKDNPNAILKHQKGKSVLDKNGKVKTIKTYVDLKEARIFKYKSFDKFVESIKKIVRLVTMIFDKRRILYSGIKLHYRYFSKITVKKDYTVLRKRKIEIKNNMINRINYRLQELQDAMYLGKLIDSFVNQKDFSKLMNKLQKLIYLTSAKWGGINVYLGYKQSFIDFINNHTDFENYVMNLIDTWYQDYVYIPYMTYIENL